MNPILSRSAASLGVGDRLGWTSWWRVASESGWERRSSHSLKACEAESAEIWLGGVDGSEDGGVGNDVIESQREVGGKEVVERECAMSCHGDGRRGMSVGSTGGEWLMLVPGVLTAAAEVIL